jgi:hypothetical protein
MTKSGFVFLTWPHKAPYINQRLTAVSGFRLGHIRVISDHRKSSADKGFLAISGCPSKNQVFPEPFPKKAEKWHLSTGKKCMNGLMKSYPQPLGFEKWESL